MTEPTKHPVQVHRYGKRNEPTTIPEPVAMKAYEVYSHVYGPQPALLDVKRGCRGGFHVRELVTYLYAASFPPSEWRARVKEAEDGMNL